jgi:16S rRNA A1518/A1519 N6-dimethyltransferase RsmA/KsgA/DIM1 with predicted DNA glycosylase/AP lyase activity
VLRAVPPVCRALNVGRGQGLLTRRLAERCEEVIGIDIDSDKLPVNRNAVLRIFNGM